MCKKIVILLCLVATGAFGQASKNQIKVTAKANYGLYNRVLPITQYMDSLLNSIYFKIDDVNAIWGTSGNSTSNNTSFLGTKTNRSLLFKTNNIQRMKLDSLGTLSWSVGASDALVLKPYPGFTVSPAMWFGTDTQTPSNFLLFNSTTLNQTVINAQNDSSSLNITKSNGSYWIQCNGIGTANQLLNPIVFRNVPKTMLAGQNGAAWSFVHHYNFIWATGAIATEYGMHLTAQTCDAVGASTMTTNYGLFVDKAIAGANMTIQRLFGLGTDGSAHITQSVVIGSSVHTPLSTLDVTGDLTLVGNIISNTGSGIKIGTATSQKIGFFNSAPVIQQTSGITAATYAPVGGSNVSSVDTFGGYTIGQLVAILKAYGLIP